MKTLVITLLLARLTASEQAVTTPMAGKALFQTNCTKCHGEDGTKGRWGAANLRESRLSDDAMLSTITTGRGFMPNWGRKFTPVQIQTIIAYIKTLRK